MDTPRNRELERLGKGDDKLVAYRTKGEFWGKERTVVVTFNPLTAAKQRYAFDKKLLDLRDTLLELKGRLSHSQKWKGKVLAHYQDSCRRLYLPDDLYQVMIEENERG